MKLPLLAACAAVFIPPAPQVLADENSRSFSGLISLIRLKTPSPADNPVPPEKQAKMRVLSQPDITAAQREEIAKINRNTMRYIRHRTTQRAEYRLAAKEKVQTETLSLWWIGDSGMEMNSRNFKR